MKQKYKHLASAIFTIVAISWSLISSAINGEWGTLWVFAGLALVIVLIGIQQYFSAGKDHRRVCKNMTAEEKEKMQHISEKIGKKIAIRVALTAVLLAISYGFIGSWTLIYTIPVAVIFLIVLCIPVWKKNKEQTDAFFQTLEK